MGSAEHRLSQVFEQMLDHYLDESGGEVDTQDLADQLAAAALRTMGTDNNEAPVRGAWGH